MRKLVSRRKWNGMTEWYVLQEYHHAMYSMQQVNPQSRVKQKLRAEAVIYDEPKRGGTGKEEQRDVR